MSCCARYIATLILSSACLALSQQLSGSLEPHSAVHGILQRLLKPAIAKKFVLELGNTCERGHQQCFHATSDGASVRVLGTSGTELAAGAHAWLKARCNFSVSWEVTGGPHIDPSCFEPKQLQQLQLTEPLYGGRAAPYFYHQNVVTVSYSSTWWSWDRWEQEIDWMALHGINLPLAFTGQELVWKRVFNRYNITDAELSSFLAGPSFLAWQRMGNVQGWGGALPLQWMHAQADLQKKILARMRSLDMTPVLPAFAGFVPDAFAAKHPEANITRLSNWGNFSDGFCCVHLLDPLDPLFVEIGVTFVKELRAVYGWDVEGWYSADTFNELIPPSNDPAYLASISAAVFKGMAEADSSARWLMQAWLFYDQANFWQPPQAQGLISGVPKGSLVLLDLYAELYPQWERYEGFYGAPWIWCMLHNFGGNIGMYGALQEVAIEPAHALHAGSALVGFGTCPEGIEQNPVVYEAMSEWAFRDKPLQLDPWIRDYVSRRYGAGMPATAYAAWQILLDTVYTARDRHIDHVRDIPTSRPGLAWPEGGLYSLKPHLWYDPQQVIRAWRLLLQAAEKLQSSSASAEASPALPDTFVYDLVDVGRQVLSKHATGLWQNIVAAYNASDEAGLTHHGEKLLELLDDMDTLLSTCRGFLFGAWLKDVHAAAQTDEQRALYEWNARTQITIWGTSADGGSEIEDYANRQWGGLMKDYYHTRWQLWIQRLHTDLNFHRAYDADAWRAESIRFTQCWTRQLKPLSMAQYPEHAVGDPVRISLMLHDKYVARLNPQRH